MLVFSQLMDRFYALGVFLGHRKDFRIFLTPLLESCASIVQYFGKRDWSVRFLSLFKILSFNTGSTLYTQYSFDMVTL